VTSQILQSHFQFCVALNGDCLFSYRLQK